LDSLIPHASETDDPALATLRRVFGHADFRGLQRGVVDHLISGGDAIVLMPTGGGKSLCYQAPALVRPGVGLVVSPLIALMRDQVEALKRVGVRAACINSSMDLEETRAAERDMIAGRLDMVYVAPERLVTPRFLGLLERARLSLIAFDEAHCISAWGHDFRPEYLQMGVLGERFPGVPRVALTATADARTRQEIAERLNLTRARWFIAGFDRPNITYRVAAKPGEKPRLLEFLERRHAKSAGIVYCLSRAKVDDTARWLSQEGRFALPYHAGLPAATRQAHQDRFLNEPGITMVATVAFGMGIDKPDVRFVAHLDPPRSLEAYYQETGRAGRDGLPADAWMAYGLADAVSMRMLLNQSDAPEHHRHAERARLDALFGYCETARCRRQVLLAYFGEELNKPCGNCDICLKPPVTWDGTEAAQKALSAVYRTGQRYGAGHLTDVLRGTATPKVLEQGHQLLKTFGVGKDLTKSDWQAVFRQLLAAGALTVDADGFGGFVITDAGLPILRGQESLRLRRDGTSERARDIRSDFRRNYGAMAAKRRGR
jgi:ATP-dependent DNA helicase RecQ